MGICRRKLHTFVGKQCMECRRERRREYRRENPEKVREQERMWKQKNPERWREARRSYRERFPEKIARWKRQGYQSHKEYIGARTKAKRSENRLLFAWTEYRATAKQRGHTFNLPRELFEDLITDNCYYCHAAPSPINGIDRVDSSRGYEEDNVVTACRPCNTAKMQRSLNDFNSWIERLFKARRRVFIELQ